MSDVETAVARLAASFAEDPVVQWLELSSPANLFRPVAEKTRSEGWLDLFLPGAVALWLPEPGATHPEQVPSQLTERQPPERLRTYIAVTEAARPRRGPYLHLPFLGVTPDQQGLGLGGRLLSHGLARAGAHGTPAYLEASSPRSAALYARHGFVRAGADIVLPGGPTLVPMWWHPPP